MGRKDLKLRWTRPALADLIEAQNYIARDNPTAAQALAERVWDAEIICATIQGWGAVQPELRVDRGITQSIRESQKSFCAFGADFPFAGVQRSADNVLAERSCGMVNPKEAGVIIETCNQSRPNQVLFIFTPLTFIM